MKVMIISTTGMIGKALLLECLDTPEVEHILAVNRQSCGIHHPKLTEIIHPNFYDFSSVVESLSGYDVCYFCMGVTSAGLSEEEYHRITYTLTTDFARLLCQYYPTMTFCYVSGAGSDSTEKGSTMWARVKGKTENALLALPFTDAYMLRPGYIQPMRGIKSKTGWYNAFYVIVRPLYPLLQGVKKYVTDTNVLSRAMLYVALKGSETKILESTDINRLGAATHSRNNTL